MERERKAVVRKRTQVDFYRDISTIINFKQRDYYNDVTVGLFADFTLVVLLPSFNEKYIENDEKTERTGLRRRLRTCFSFRFA